MSEDDNFTRKLEKIIKPWMLIVIFIIFIVIGFAREADASERTGVQIEAGAGLLSGQFSKGAAVTVQQRFDNKFSLGMGYISEQWVTPRTEPKTHIQENLWVQGQRHIDLGKFDLGLGVAYFNRTNRALGSHFTAALSLQFNATDRWNIKLRHYSNAGSASPNMGQDMLLIGYRF